MIGEAMGMSPGLLAESAATMRAATLGLLAIAGELALKLPPA